MALPVLVRVSFIPLKPGTSIQRVLTFSHDLSIYLIYTRRKPVGDSDRGEMGSRVLPTFTPQTPPALLPYASRRRSRLKARRAPLPQEKSPLFRRRPMRRRRSPGRYRAADRARPPARCWRFPDSPDGRRRTSLPDAPWGRQNRRAPEYALPLPRRGSPRRRSAPWW